MDATQNLTETFLETHHLMHRYHMTWYGKNFGGLDPRQGQGRILTALRRMNTVSQKELGFILDIRPQSLGELLQKLESNGYIERKRSPTDKRALIVELTEKGESFQLRKPDYEELFADLSDPEREILRKALLKIGDRLERLISKEDEEFY